MVRNILELQHLKKYFPVTANYTVKAVDDISLTVRPGEILGLVGESGCGKSTLARTVMEIYQPTSGNVIFNGHNRQMIFQDADGALNPRMSVEEILFEAVLLTNSDINKKAAEPIITTVLSQVELEQRYRSAFPQELSGGQRQRVGIARSIITNPDLIVADEPIAALDVSIQAQIINLLNDLQQKQGFAMLFIAHDLAMVRYLSQSVAVMYQGRLVEYGETEAVFNHPANAYTQILLASVLRPDPKYERQKQVPELIKTDIGLERGSALREIAPCHWAL